MDIRAQAELRRKKILANAEARLRKITGKPTDDVDISRVPSEAVASPQPVNGLTENGSYHKDSCPSFVEDTLSSSNEETRAPEEDLAFLTSQLNLENSFNESTKSGALSSRQPYSLKFDCCFFLCMGVFIRILIHLGHSWIFLNNILGPFVMVCIPQLATWYQNSIHPAGLLTSLAPLVGRHEQRLLLFLKLASTIRTITKFFALYLFSFILTEYFLGERVT